MARGSGSGGPGGSGPESPPQAFPSGLTALLRIYRSNLVLAEAFCADIPPGRGEDAAAGGPGRPAARILRHLILASSLLAEDLELRAEESRSPVPTGAGGPGTPTEGGEGVPAAQDLLRELRRQHDRVVRALRGIDSAALDEPFEWPLGRSMATLRDALKFFILSHESMHLAQLASWREDRDQAPGGPPTSGPSPGDARNRGGPAGRGRPGRGGEGPGG